MTHAQMLELYRAMVTARAVDRVEQELTGRGEAFFHVSGAGHESAAALAPHLVADDWLHCHYRDDRTRHDA
jgi:2-oxoisovalerate dehydrogenase E1 component